MFKDYSILLVEDDKNMQEYMRHILEEECKEFIVADDGDEGLEMYRIYKPNIVISDLNMPMMNGISLSKEIKRDNPIQPIILLTAFGKIEELQEAINIGINAYISKPIESIDILFNTMKKLLNQVEQKNKNNSTNKTEVDSSELKDLVCDILHDNNEYIDYDSLKGIVK